MDIYLHYKKKWQADIVLPLLWKMREREYLVYWAEQPGVICIRLTPVGVDAAIAWLNEQKSNIRRTTQL